MIGLGRLRICPLNEDATPEEIEMYSGADITLQNYLNDQLEFLFSEYAEAKIDKLPTPIIAEMFAALNRIKSQIKDAKEIAPYIDDEIAKLAIGKPSSLRIDVQLISKSAEKQFTYLSVKECEQKIRERIRAKKASGKAPKFPAQQMAIFAEIEKLSYDPLRLPKDEPGKGGVTAEIRSKLVGTELFLTRNIFDTVWDKLSKEKIIVKLK
jgi:hypothetical protein